MRADRTRTDNECPCHLATRAGNQLLAQVFRTGARVKHGVAVIQLLGLSCNGLNHSLISMADAGHCCSSSGIEYSSAIVELYVKPGR
jgi:hypothetical protein